ncbi:MAG: bifunctional nuclease family protein [candidate division Zixibacteria bacterium]|nr:bifunctional nuclease family protein [candidate division Zixibacteria bacterium]
MKLLEAKVESLALDMTTNSPVVILAPSEINKVLPIWIGHAEAWSIAMQLSGVIARRPMTYDLLVEIINTLNAKITRVEITELKEQTFYARLYLFTNGEEFFIDARPSDSIALALKTDSKIFVNEELFDLSNIDSPDIPDIPNDPESLRERLRKIDPEDFGKYSL